MFVYQLTASGSEVLVKLDVTSAQQMVPIEYEGDDEAIAAVKDWLRYAYGAFGHFIGESTTALDLEVAMKSPDAAAFFPKRIAGGELVQNAGSGLPPDVMT